MLSACAADQQSITPPPEAQVQQAALPVEPPPPPTLAERIGDVPRHGKALLVNIPSYELIAFEDGEPVMRSRVIVGSRKNRTPLMETYTTVVRFRPTWTPTPDMIASGEYEPGTRPPGKRNPLGYLAIRLEEDNLIYLHGTNRPKLFNRDRRALSHGCIRVEKWDEIAAWVLDTDVETVHAHAYGNRTFDMNTLGLPVMVRYYTEFPNAEGMVQEYADIYGLGARDRMHDSMMAKSTLH